MVDAVLTEWSISDPTDTGVRKIRGKIYNDKLKRFEDGTYVLTSKIVAFDEETSTARTASGTIYRLKDKANG